MFYFIKIPEENRFEWVFYTGGKKLAAVRIWSCLRSEVQFVLCSFGRRNNFLCGRFSSAKSQVVKRIQGFWDFLCRVSCAQSVFENKWSCISPRNMPGYFIKKAEVPPRVFLNRISSYVSGNLAEFYFFCILHLVDSAVYHSKAASCSSTLVYSVSPSSSATKSISAKVKIDWEKKKKQMRAAGDGGVPVLPVVKLVSELHWSTDMTTNSCHVE